MEVHRVAVISDTHGLLRHEVVEQIKSCEVILHAGDIDHPEILAQLGNIKPIYAVRGNADGDWAGELPVELEMELFGFQIYMIHNRKQIQKDDARFGASESFDIVISGHSHKYHEERTGKTLYLNPGSCGRRRFRLPLTMVILLLYPEEHRIETQKIDFTQAVPAPSEGTVNLSEKDMYRLVKAVMKEVNAGRTIADIAARHHVNEELTGQICRMYVTHSGVDVDGIIDRLERKNL